MEDPTTTADAIGEMPTVGGANGSAFNAHEDIEKVLNQGKLLDAGNAKRGGGRLRWVARECNDQEATDSDDWF